MPPTGRPSATWGWGWPPWRAGASAASEQLRLPLDIDVPFHRTSGWRKAMDFAKGAGPKLGAGLLFRVGVPVIGVASPAVLQLADPDGEHGLIANLAVGSALGGAWGAMVGASVPAAFGDDLTRIRASGKGLAKGIVGAPVIAVASKLVVDWALTPVIGGDGTERNGDPGHESAPAPQEEPAGQPGSIALPGR